jgi:hypothetical protein
MSEQPLPDLPTVEDPENPSVNGKTIHVDGCWPCLVWLFGPIRQGGTGMIIALMVIAFGAYELDKLGSPLLTKYGEYIKGQTDFTETVKKAMESQAHAIETQTAAIESTRTLVAQNGTRIDTTSAAAIEAAAQAKIAASNANESARLAATATAEVAARLLEAKQEMSAVSARRDLEAEERIKSIDAQTGVLGKLLSVQESVLQTLKDTASKNSEAPPMPNDGGA